MKKACKKQAFFLFNAFKFDFLVLDNGIIRASASASATANARISVDNVDATF